jgi:hypothetical protein
MSVKIDFQTQKIAFSDLDVFFGNLGDNQTFSFSQLQQAMKAKLG